MNSSRLKAILLKTGLQNKDNVLYQIINSLIDGVVALEAANATKSDTTTITQHITKIEQLIDLSSSDSSGDDISIPGPRGADGIQGVTGPQGNNPFLLGEEIYEDNVPIPGPVGPTGAAGAAGALVLLEQHSGSAASLDFTTFYSATYDEYIFELISITPQTDNVDLLFRCSTDGGVTYDAGANYARALRLDNQAFNTVLGADSGLTSVILAPNVDNTTTEASLNMTIHLYNPGSAALFKSITIHGMYKNQDSHYYAATGHGLYLSATAVNAVRFTMSSGNILGTIRCYGVVKT